VSEGGGDRRWRRCSRGCRRRDGGRWTTARATHARTPQQAAAMAVAVATAVAAAAAAAATVVTLVVAARGRHLSDATYICRRRIRSHHCRGGDAAAAACRQFCHRASLVTFKRFEGETGWCSKETAAYDLQWPAGDPATQLFGSDGMSNG